ncbi:MAG: hypothetical protein K8S98_17835 [Planctomycetes bacterium]|nr:hypothetical protein [Planctomycetota bacterium]
MIERGVFALALRRAFGIGSLVVFVLTAFAIGWIDWQGATGLPRGEAWVLRGLERRGLWVALIVLLGSAAIARAAGQFARWRAREFDWIAAVPVARARWLVSTWAGEVVALAMFLVVAAGFVELSIGESRAAERVVEVRALPRIALVDATSRVEWRFADAPSDARARIELALAGGGRAAEVRWRARRGEVSSATGAIVGLRKTLELALPPGEGPVTFDLERVGEGAIVVADPDGLCLAVPVASDRLATVAIALRLGPALAAAAALALGLGAWISAPSAFAATLAFWIAAWFTARPSSFVPAADVFDALEFVAAGLVPPLPGAVSYVGAALLVVVGLVLAAARPWKRNP